MVGEVGLHYRALAVEHEDAIVWFWIGTHAVCNVSFRQACGVAEKVFSMWASEPWPIILQRYLGGESYRNPPDGHLRAVEIGEKHHERDIGGTDLVARSGTVSCSREA